MVEEVALFGESKTEDVEKDRLIWTGEDGKKTTGVLRPLASDVLETTPPKPS